MFWELMCPFLDLATLLQVRLICVEAQVAVDEYLKHYQYSSTQMLLQYRGEETQGRVKYLSEQEREENKLQIVDGKFYMNGSLFSSGFSSGSGPQAQQAHLFAISLSGDFYVYRKVPGINHSSMLSGANVICAGFICIVGGKLQYISNCSGHYQPQVDALLTAIQVLLHNGIAPTQYKLKYEAPRTIRPKDFNSAQIFIDGVPRALKGVVKNLGLLLDQ